MLYYMIVWWMHRGICDLFSAQSSVNVIPYYSAVDKSLSKLTIQGINLTVGFLLTVIHCSTQCMNALLWIPMQIASSDTANIFIMKYSLSYSDPTTGSVVYSTNVSTCGEDVCVNDVSLPSPSLVCPSSIITVTADNGFRQRLLSDPIIIGICMSNTIVY